VIFVARPASVLPRYNVYPSPVPPTRDRPVTAVTGAGRPVGVWLPKRPVRYAVVALRGVWRSLVARFVRDEEVVGSNPATPTAWRR
jgi:hypothetical protein